MIDRSAAFHSLDLSEAAGIRLYKTDETARLCNLRKKIPTR